MTLGGAAINIQVFYNTESRWPRRILIEGAVSCVPNSNYVEKRHLNSYKGVFQVIILKKPLLMPKTPRSLTRSKGLRHAIIKKLIGTLIVWCNFTCIRHFKNSSAQSRLRILNCQTHFRLFWCYNLDAGNVLGSFKSQHFGLSFGICATLIWFFSIGGFRQAVHYKIVNSYFFAF